MTKNILIYLITLIIIFLLDIISILWFARSAFLYITITSVINLILIKLIEKRLHFSSCWSSLIIIVSMYLILFVWYLLTYSCKECYDLYLIKALLLIPIITYILSFIYELVVKLIYASKNKR